MQDIKESDWKYLRDLSRIALDRFCERALGELVRVAADPDKGAHVRYLAVYKLLHRENEQLAHAFDDLRRSSALIQLALMCRLKLITDDEFSRFSEPTRQFVESMLSL